MNQTYKTYQTNTKWNKHKMNKTPKNLINLESTTKLKQQIARQKALKNETTQKISVKNQTAGLCTGTHLVFTIQNANLICLLAVDYAEEKSACAGHAKCGS